jgi:hypothetical protein
VRAADLRTTRTNQIKQPAQLRHTTEGLVGPSSSMVSMVLFRCCLRGDELTSILEPEVSAPIRCMGITDCSYSLVPGLFAPLWTIAEKL